VVPKLLDTTPACGPPLAWPISSTSDAGFDTTRGTSGGSWDSWAGAASVPRGVPWSVMKRPSGTGRDTAGLPLKKSSRRRSDHRLRRRERAESKTPRLPHLGSTRRDSGPAIPLSLGQPLGDRRSDVVEVLLQAFPGDCPGSAGSAVPASLAAAPPRAVARDLGWAAPAPESSGQGAHCPTSRAPGDRVPARVRSRAESGGVFVGILEAS